jgi:hypothetical protein
LAAFIVFFVFIALATVLISAIRQPSAFTVWLPFALGTLYTVMPDIPLPFDDAAVATAGAIATFALWLKRQPDIPKTTVIPLLFAALYTLVGGFIPFPVDELLVSGISVAAAVAMSKRPTTKAIKPSVDSPAMISPPDDDGLP